MPLAITVLGLSFLLLSGVLLETGNSIIVKKIPVHTVLSLLLYKLPSVIVAALPLAALFASMFSLGRMGIHRELMAMRIAGLPCRKIMLPYLVFALLLSCAAYGINEYVSPRANREAETLLRRIIYESPLPAMTENLVFRDNNRFFYLAKIDPQSSRLYNIIMYEVQDGRAVCAVLAKEGRYTANVWSLADGAVYEFSETGLINRETKFTDLTVNVELGNIDIYRRQRSGDEMSRQEVAELIAFFQERSIDTTAFEVDYHVKSSLPLAPLAFVMLGAPIIIKVRSHQQIYSVGVSISVALLYFIANSFSFASGRAKVLPPFLAAWLPNMLAFVIGTLLAFWADRRNRYD